MPCHRLRAAAARACLALAVLAVSACNGQAGDSAGEPTPAVTPTAVAEGDVGEPGQPEEEPNPCGPDALEPPEQLVPDPPPEDATPVQVTFVDYAFEGLEDTYEAGSYAFEATNEGQELHEMVVFRIADGEERPVEELLQLPPEQAGEAVEPVGGTFACPGEEAAPLGIEVEAGRRYAVICFLPVGITEEAETFADADGPPHFTQGMWAELTGT